MQSSTRVKIFNAVIAGAIGIMIAVAIVSFGLMSTNKAQAAEPVPKTVDCLALSKEAPEVYGYLRAHPDRRMPNRSRWLQEYAKAYNETGIDQKFAETHISFDAYNACIKQQNSKETK